MVNIEDIDEIITRLLKQNNHLTVKCGLTISEMHSKLEKMRVEGNLGFEDLLNQLDESNQINPLEKEEYESVLKEYNKVWKQWDKASYGSEKYNQLYDELMVLEEDLFQYNRRLVDGGIKRNDPPIIDISSFQSDKKLSSNDRWEKNGNVEDNQIEAQKKGLDLGNKVDEYTETMLFDDTLKYTYEQYDDPRCIAMNNYFNGDCSYINYTISHKGYLNALSKEQKKQMKDIDSLMEESPGLLQDTVLYRGGYWDIHLNVGDHSKGFKGYQSTTFQEGTANEYKSLHKEQTGNKGMLIKILAPKGTKGIVGNDNRFNNGFIEHEYVLPRNQGFTVVDIDYNKMVATVVLDE